jgi:hypothetical protein
MLSDEKNSAVTERFCGEWLLNKQPGRGETGGRAHGGGLLGNNNLQLFFEWFPLYILNRKQKKYTQTKTKIFLYNLEFCHYWH